MYEYRVTIDRVVDGDTVDCWIDLGFNTQVFKRVRFVGINAPETRTRDKEEKRFGLLSKQFVKDHYPVGSTAILRTHKDKTGKFGRILGELVWEKTTINKKMVVPNYTFSYLSIFKCINFVRFNRLYHGIG